MTHTVKVWAEVHNPDGVLKDGLTAKMAIERENVDHAYAARRKDGQAGKTGDGETNR